MTTQAHTLAEALRTTGRSSIPYTDPFSPDRPLVLECYRAPVPCRWRLVAVPGIGHEGMRMSGIAAAYWFDGETPRAPAELRQAGTEL